MNKALLIVLIIFSTQLVSASTYLYVDSSVSSSGSGTSWTAAYKTLNEALNVANTSSVGSNYVINIARGTYYAGGTRTTTVRDTFFRITRSGIELYGGYQSGGVTRNPSVYPTILDGEINTTNNFLYNVRHLMIIKNIGVSTNGIVLDGLSLSHASAFDISGTGYNSLGAPYTQGAALYLKSVECQVTIRNCRIMDNYAQFDGAGIFIQDSIHLMIDSCFLPITKVNLAEVELLII